jgi:hypothetical protein
MGYLMELFGTDSLRKLLMMVIKKVMLFTMISLHKAILCPHCVNRIGLANLVISFAMLRSVELG